MIKAVIFDIGGVLAHDVWEHLVLDKPEGIASRYGLVETQVEEVRKELWDKFMYDKGFWEKFGSNPEKYGQPLPLLLR